MSAFRACFIHTALWIAARHLVFDRTCVASRIDD